MSSESYLEHIGVARRSGRYPWGSGGNEIQRNKSFLDYIKEMLGLGMTETEIARGVGMSTTELRALKSIAKNEIRKADQAEAFRLKEKGLSNVAIGEKMGRNESSIRSLLDPSARERADVISSTANQLRDAVESKQFLDVGKGTENHMGVSPDRLRTAIAVLKEEGYTIHYVKVPQLGTGNYTSVKVLAPPDTSYLDVVNNQDKIKPFTDFSEDGGRTFYKIEPPKSISSGRVEVNYVETGGGDADGVIYVRRNVDDIALGRAQYAQVRIAVDDTHYLKGMAVYKDDMPPGVDLIFNTNKSDTGNKLDAMKSVKDDSENPFGAVTRQLHYKDDKGKDHISVMNIVNEEGNWKDWSRNLSSQMLSKQSPILAQTQLDLTMASKKSEFDEIMALTNPTVKKALLETYSDSVDASSVHLKAAALPRQGTHVILPINSLGDNEIYAPNYRNGEKVVLVRYPHGGTFEIPELTVNNRNQEAGKTMKNAQDAVGINSKVAARLSGADFDGDTVLVIPNQQSGPNRVKTTSPLEGLKNFDPQTAYPGYEGMPKMRSKQQEMGKISNLITDMTIMGATHSEIARAVKHSMVVIDAEKHNLNYKQSALDNQITQLKAKYQGGPKAGASTLISRASSDVLVPHRKDRPASEGGAIDPVTGKKVYKYTGDGYIKTTTNKRTGVVTEKFVDRTVKSKRIAEVDDAFKLTSKTKTKIETIYANHANGLKALANQARKEVLKTPPLIYSPSANKAYAQEVASLNAKLNRALKNAPLERQAQILGNAVVKAKREANPNMDSDELKKLKGQELNNARIRTGAKKTQVTFTPKEWEAIQAGAISNSKLQSILANADMDSVKKLATPRIQTGLSNIQMTRARQMLASGYTQAEIADQLGVPASTLNDNINKK